LLSECVPGRWLNDPSLLLGRTSAGILGAESRGTHDHILLSHIQDFPNVEGQVPQELGGSVISPGTEFPFRPFLRLAGLRWRYLNLPPCRQPLKASQVRMKVTLRLAVHRQPFILAHDQNFSAVSAYVTSSPTSGWVCLP
jgi:hypothetical protein